VRAPFLAWLSACAADLPARGVPAPGPDGLVFEDPQVLVVPDAEGLALITAAGDRRVVAWSDALGPCPGCEGQGASADGDGLLVSVAVGQTGGSVARLGAEGELHWRIDGLRFPHDAVRDPDATVAVAEAAAQRLVWLDPRGPVGAEVRELGGLEVPNGLHGLAWGGRELLLASTRGRPGVPGQVVLLELRPDGIALLRWALDGLDVPHSPLIRRRDGRHWLLWAEAGGTGRVGVAVTDDPLDLPRVIAHLVPPPDAAFGLLRGVELTRDGWLLLVDSSGEGGGRVLRAPFPALDVDEELQIVELGPLDELVAGLPRPFEGWLWTPPPAFRP
jgi:hypothetical protein